MDPLSVIAAIIKKEVPRLTLAEAAHVAWEVISVIKELNGTGATEKKEVVTT